MSRPESPLEAAVVFHTPWFDLLAKSMEAGEEPYYSLRLPDYAAILATRADGRVLTVRQYRPAVERYTLELPSGLIDPGKSPAEAARRELLEETGYGGGTWSPLLTLSANPALQDNLTHTYLAEGVTLLQPPHPESSEDLRVHLIPVAEVGAMIDNGVDFIQALHVAPLLYYLLKRRGK